MGQGTLRRSGTGRGIIYEVRDGSEGPLEGPKWVERSSQGSGTGRGTIPRG